ncbi:MAG: glycosyltransferase family 4 protein [Oscillospiraceae bacterium]|nr:glycosyltransferase family 4 protein [Oscillospiraceae bacterium]
MKLLQVCAYTAQYSGNFIASLLALDQRLSARGVETMYLFPETVAETPWCQQLSRTRQVFFAGLNRFSYATFRQVKAAMAQADMIHSHFELYDCLCAFAKTRKQKLFWHLHDSFEENIDLPHQLINRFQYGVCGKKAIMISPNRYYADYTVSLGFPEKNVHIVDNCIDCSRLVSREALTKQYDFLVFGGFYKTKGLDILMDACRMLHKAGRSFKLAIVGYPQTWEYLDATYPDMACCTVRLAPSENVSAFYDSAKVFLSTSRRECFSYALLEALYKKLPAIVSDIPGNQWAKNFDTACFFETENPEALADRMAQLLTDNRFPSQALENTSAQIKAQYSCTAWAERIEEIYFA